jgi:HEAT repeat protein
MVWASEYTAADMDLRIQALGSLIRTDATRVIPILRNIALESENPDEASRAVFVLAQSGRPDAFNTLLELAKQAPAEAVSVAAVRQLGRFGGPRMSDELLLVYEVGKPRVKLQVVNSLGERHATNALFRIVESEPDYSLKEVAIVTLGRAGGRTQLQRFYRRARPELKKPIIVGLFNARAEDELIEIAEHERDAALKTTVFNSLRLLGTPKSREYLEKTQTSR